MSIKTTNPALVKKYLKGVLEPGDCSKDFIVEKEYALVFKGKIPYRKDTKNSLVMWRDKEGVFYRYMFHITPKINELLTELTPKSVCLIRCQDPTLYAYNGICGLVQACRYDNPHDVSRFIQKINLTYQGVDEERLWEFFKDNDEILSPLWNGKFDLGKLPESIKVEILTRKMLSL